jgi:Cation transporter/ATPase, N-terminus
MAWHEQGIEEALKNLGARMEGLAEIEAHERLERYGKNGIIHGKPPIQFCYMITTSGVIYTGKRCFRGSSIGLATPGRL